MSVATRLHGAGSTVFSNLFVTLPIPTTNTDLSNHTVIVTGANTGLGLESCRHLLRLGVGRLIMAVRTPSKGEEAKKQLLSSASNTRESIDVWPIDMDSYDSIKAFATRASQLQRLDGVLANAGIMTTQFSLSEDTEKTLTINVIGTFLLYLLLLPKMRESGNQTGNACRFVIPNSALHYEATHADLDLSKGSFMERWNDPKKADMAGRYNLSKFLVILAVREFAERSESSKKGPIIINTPNPSFCVSNLAREMHGNPGFKVFEKALARSTEEGSRALVHGLLAGRETNGQYLTNCHVAR